MLSLQGHLDQQLDQHRMRQALQLAEIAALSGEIPVGAVLVCAEENIFASGNRKECQTDPTAHAEICVIRKAAQSLKRWRLGGTLYVTLAPCMMCMGAIIEARINRLVYGATHPMTSPHDTMLEQIRSSCFNHAIEIVGGVLAGEATLLIHSFFNRLRGRS